MVPALAFNSIIVATNACRSKWSKHDVALSDNFFTHVPFFNSCKTIWAEQCGNLEELSYLGKAALVCPG